VRHAPDPPLVPATVGHRWLVMFALTVGLLARLAVAWQPLPVLIAKVLPDAAFHYLTIARHLVGGLGPTFDTLAATNGFQPLWMGVVSGLTGLLGPHNPWTLYGVLAAGVFLDGLVALVVYRLLLGAFANRTAALVGTAAYWWNPMAVALSVNGLETAASLLSLATVVWLLVRRSPGGGWLLGVACGLAVLARLDNLAVVAAVLVSILAAERGLGRLAAFTKTAVALSFVVAPWVAWNAITFGPSAPASAWAAPAVLHQNFAAVAGPGSGPWVKVGLSLLGQTLTYGLPRATGLSYLAAVALAAVGLGAWMQKPVDPKRSGRIALILGPLAVGLVASLAVHASIRWAVRPWHLAPGVLLTALVLGCGAALLAEMPWGRATVRTLAVAVAMVYLGVGLRSWQEGLYPWQTSYLEAARWVAHNSPPAARLAGFNVGIVAYVSGRAAISLDGSVNNELLPWIKSRNLWRYCEERGVRYLVVSEELFRSVYRRAWGLDPKAMSIVEVARFDQPGLGSPDLPVAIYEVRGARPAEAAGGAFERASNP
jgi:hypothetical protein